ncbi:hypothetical protein N7513_008932 [Penicillium frequentans]|nr:hypothetical protein N7513_008932 [Penicillium glabrum]
MNRSIGAAVRAHLEQGQSIAEMALGTCDVLTCDHRNGPSKVAKLTSGLLKATEEEDPSAPPGNQALNEDGRLMIIARRSLQRELYGGFESPWSSQFTNEKLQGLLYLEAVINETLRLKSSVPSGHPIVTPPERLQLDEVWILGETIIFTSGSDFIPERWLDEGSNLIKHEEAFFPFQLGKYIIFFTETRIDILNDTSGRYGSYGFDFAFATIGDEVAFGTDSKDTSTFTIEPLHLIFKG